MARNPHHNLSRGTLLSLIKSHEEKGYMSLESLASWNRIIKVPQKKNQEKEFVCKKQHEFIESSIFKGSLNVEAIDHLLYTVDILKKNRTGK